MVSFNLAHVQCVIAFPFGVGNNSGMYNKNNDSNKKLCNIVRWDKGDVSMYYYITGLHLQNLELPYDLLSCNCDVTCLLYTSPSPRDRQKSRMPSSA